MKKILIGLVLTLVMTFSYGQVLIDDVDKGKAWIYTYNISAAKQVQIDNLSLEIVRLNSELVLKQGQINALNTEIVRLKAIIAGTVPPPVVVPPSTNIVIFNGKSNDATITPYGGGSTLQPWYNDLRALGYPEFGFQTSNQYTKNEMIVDNGVKVLKAQIIGTNPNDAGRFQASTYLPSKDLGIYHHSQRMKFGPDIAGISNYPSAINAKSGSGWFTIFETWMGQSVTRMNLSLNKVAGTGMPVRWELMAEWEEGSSTPYRTIWSAVNDAVPVPFDKWFVMDVFIKSGEGANGNIKIIITVDGEAPVTLFDVKNTTTVPGQPSVFRRKTDHMKFYMGPALRKYMFDSGKVIEVSYGDYKIFKD